MVLHDDVLIENNKYTPGCALRDIKRKGGVNNGQNNAQAVGECIIRDRDHY